MIWAESIILIFTFHIHFFHVQIYAAPENVSHHPNVKVTSLEIENGQGQVWAEAESPSNSMEEVDKLNFETRSYGNNLSLTRSSEVIDYIDLERELTYNGGPLYEPVTVEVMVVCDKEFSDLFEVKRRRILDYLTVLFWDVNMRFHTPNVETIRITAVEIIRSTSSQPFIEEARNRRNNRTDLHQILPRFSNWMYETLDFFPKYDLGILITNSKLVDGQHGGLSYFRGVCNIDRANRKHYGTLVVHDTGEWFPTTLGLPHQIGHALGALHDDAEADNFPHECQDRGQVMSTGRTSEFNTKRLRFFMSPCSISETYDFIRSDQASCLRQLDFQGDPPVTPGYGVPMAPSLDVQCQRILNDDNAFCAEEDRANCQEQRCRLRGPNGLQTVTRIGPADHSPCAHPNSGRRCFRGRCMDPGYLIMNMQSGKCMQAFDSYSLRSIVTMEECPVPKDVNPLNAFTIRPGPHGRQLGAPWYTIGGAQSGEKCLVLGDRGNEDRPPEQRDYSVRTLRCEQGSRARWQGWDFIELEFGEVMLRHRATGTCAKQVGSYIQNVMDCDNSEDESMRWMIR